MTGLIVKDFLVMRKSIKTYILFLLFYFVMAALGIFPISFITAMVQIIIMMLPLSAFSYDELSKWDRYAFSLPLSRRAVGGRPLPLRSDPHPVCRPVRPGDLPDLVPGFS